MIAKKEWIAMLLAGGQGSRLYALTRNVAKPAVPFGGKYRIIDFPLSNCVNSGIDTVGVLTQYEPHVLNAYIGSGWMLEGFRYITDIGGISTAIELDLPCMAIFSERMISFSGMPLPP